MRPFRAIGHYIKNTDLYLLIISLLCSGYGLVLIYSATRAYQSNRHLTVQIVAIVLGVAAFVIASLFDPENIAPAWKWILVLNMLFQCTLFLFGVDSGGNRSWLVLGPLSLQPGELGKIIFIFTFAAHLTQVRDHMNHWKTLLLLGLHTLLIMGAVVVPSDDLGVGISYFCICVIMLFAAGLSLKWFFGGLVAGIAAIPFVWQALKNYQITRILVLFDPSIDPATAWQTTQSKIAIGAGQFYGTGFLQGNQTQYNMLPAKHTDFIFAVAGEEFGFIGSCLIVLLLSLLILRLLYVSYKAETPFSSILAVGIAGMFLFQMFLNIFMCIGLMPVMGLTLPFFSYGGTSVVTMFVAVGLAAGVRMREKPSWLQT